MAGSSPLPLLVRANWNRTMVPIFTLRKSMKAFRSSYWVFERLKFVQEKWSLFAFRSIARVSGQVERGSTTKCNYRSLSAAAMLELHSNAAAKYEARPSVLPSLLLRSKFHEQYEQGMIFLNILNYLQILLKRVHSSAKRRRERWLSGSRNENINSKNMRSKFKTTSIGTYKLHDYSRKC